MRRVKGERSLPKIGLSVSLGQFQFEFRYPWWDLTPRLMEVWKRGTAARPGFTKVYQAPWGSVRVKKPDLVGANGVGELYHVQAGVWDGPFPKLVDVMCSAQYEDGTFKQPGQLTIKVCPGCVRAFLRVGEEPFFLPVEVQELGQVLVALEALLATPNVPWKADKPKDEPKKKK